MRQKISLMMAIVTILCLALSVGAFAEEAELPAEAEILNAAELNPKETGIPALDQLVTDTMDALVTGDMTTYEQVKACYDYLLDNMSYASSMRYLNVPVADGVTCGDIFYSYGEVNGFGAVALTANKGLCNGYAAGFILMARKIGLDAKLVSGGTLSGGGGYSAHKWAQVIVGDVAYVFDPQLDQNVESWGLPAYSLFCKTYAQTGNRYSRY